jgi:hypothetical protein
MKEPSRMEPAARANEPLNLTTVLRVELIAA